MKVCYTRTMSRRSVSLGANGPGSTYFAKVVRKDICAFCGDTKSESVDHIHPVSKGGYNTWLNFAGACKKCNEAKSSRSLLEFMLSRTKIGKRVTVAGEYNLPCSDINRLPDRWYDPLGLLLERS